MTFKWMERVFIGNDIDSAQMVAYVNFKSDNTLELIDIVGRMPQVGDIIIGEDSGFTKLIQNVNTDNLIGPGEVWDTTDWITLDDGDAIALDEHFTGKRSQNYDRNSIIII